MQGCWVSSGPGVQPDLWKSDQNIHHQLQQKQETFLCQVKPKLGTDFLGEQYREKTRKHYYVWVCHLHLKYCMHFWHFFIPKRDAVYLKKTERGKKADEKQEMPSV